jgi:hypothetical protein
MDFNTHVALADEFVFAHDFLPVGTVLKNHSRNMIERKIPELKPLLDYLFMLLPENKKHEMVDVFKVNIDASKGTCVDTGWHLDGKMNPDDLERYCIWSEGDFRTLFHTKKTKGEIESFPKNPSERHDLFSRLLGHDLHDESKGFEVPNCVPAVYSTLDFHKGRVATHNGQRMFVRVMTSNEIKPKPINLSFN